MHDACVLLNCRQSERCARFQPKATMRIHCLRLPRNAGVCDLLYQKFFVSTYLGADKDLVARKLLQASPQEALSIARPVKGSHVKEVDTIVEGQLDGCHGLLVVWRLRNEAHTTFHQHDAFIVSMRLSMVDCVCRSSEAVSCMQVSLIRVAADCVAGL